MLVCQLLRACLCTTVQETPEADSVVPAWHACMPLPAAVLPGSALPARAESDSLDSAERRSTVSAG